MNRSRCADRFAAGPQQNVEPAKRKRWGKCICMSWPVFFQTWAAPDWLPAARTTRGAPWGARGVRGGPPVNAQGTHPPCRISAASFLGTKVQKIPNKSPSSCHPVLGVLGGGQVNEGPRGRGDDAASSSMIVPEAQFGFSIFSISPSSSAFSESHAKLRIRCQQM